MYKLDQYFGKRPKKLIRMREGQEPPRPLSVKIKLTWHCNLKCRMCSQWRIEGKKPPRPSYFNSWESLKSVLDDLIFLKAKKVHFSGGEPLIFPWLAQGIRYLTDHGRHVTLVSNGTLWTQQRAEELISAGLSQITFSIDSPNPQTFTKIRGEAQWEKLIKGIENTRSAIQQSSQLISLKANSVVTAMNFHELKDLPQLAHDLGIHRLRLLPVDDLHQETGPSIRLNEAQIKTYNREIAPEFAEKALKWGLIRTAFEAYPFGTSQTEISASAQGLYAKGFYQKNLCFAPWLHTLIAADGKVYACCMLKGEKQALAQLSETEGFSEIWTGEAYQNFRREIQEQTPSICQNCDDYLSENQYLNQLIASVESKSPTKNAPGRGAS
ncbi:hypothetical protein COW36_09820 [bacterium (Candidatus Blackallbacteria) CG17_big_fil_post_rev_8_21_14_2_50_48_46]|uniref:Radical SAM core domain-containing protein n=1 Tax=bacterium (Candidatus Blackallbacteria) CG17_big_fil_post_rev_8_21_14_2_50_48_46 TaxID=2014261 RepID=A0A2M7G5X6_9BACT|nr:MAG: hypothetical protein COW64_01590 [bacterium (Candidatus Blackallbacteria) CG18_big_fil_WC_8_21_14_2_50_49_26]PIW17257.1 MAG: hypothetical protein COW36_09820 [bacterium (Candidatus Blackallbacteria) CG17_big_fil_post_rev_8_21_14_2_50_48_46]PIW51049.1 MAG: hypothetical protein COW20_00830 [bacterium (Candidatus Blackallbacteria) CG13_big_fil_rev_8_21_14_2_50_49_14]